MEVMHALTGICKNAEKNTKKNLSETGTDGRVFNGEAMQMARLSQKNLSVRKPLAPVYLLYGTQDYLIELMEKRIIHEALSDETVDFNLSRYDMFETPIETALEDADTPPFFGARKIVVIQHPFFLSGAKVKTKIDQNMKPLEAYLDQPSPSAVLIIAAAYEKLDRRKKLVRGLEKKAEIYELSKPSDALTYDLLQKVAGTSGADYTKAGHERLVALFGTDLRRLASEVKKCALYCGDSRPIDEHVVEEVASVSMESNVFRLVDKVMQQKTADALRILHDLMLMKEEPLKLLALIERQFRIVCQVEGYQKMGYTQKQIAGKTGVHPYVVRLASEQTGRYDSARLQQTLVKCSDTDYQMKTGMMDKQLALELLIHEISSV